MPPHVLPTLLFGGICRGHVTSRTHHHSRLPPLRVRAAQALPVKGFPKGKPLWPLFRAFLAGQKGTSADQRGERNINRKKPCAAEIPDPQAARRSHFRSPKHISRQGPPGPPGPCAAVNRKSSSGATLEKKRLRAAPAIFNLCGAGPPPGSAAAAAGPGTGSGPPHR